MSSCRCFRRRRHYYAFSSPAFADYFARYYYWLFAFACFAAMLFAMPPCRLPLPLPLFAVAYFSPDTTPSPLFAAAWPPFTVPLDAHFDSLAFALFFSRRDIIF